MITVVAGVWRRDGRLLIQERPKTKRDGGKWEFPGGKVKVDEPMADALRREWLEELGCAIDVGRLIGEVTVPPGTPGTTTAVSTTHLASTILLRFFSVSSAQHPTPCEGQRLAWCGLQELTRLNLCDADRLFLSRFGESLADQN